MLCGDEMNEAEHYLLHCTSNQGLNYMVKNVSCGSDFSFFSFTETSLNYQRPSHPSSEQPNMYSS